MVKSLATPDGGKPGVLTEVSRRNAAILLTDGRAELAGMDEANEFREKTRRAKLAAEQAEAGRRLRFPWSGLKHWSGSQGAIAQEGVGCDGTIHRRNDLGTRRPAGA